MRRKITNERIEERVAELGFSLGDILWDKPKKYSRVSMTCSRGHHKVVSVDNLLREGRPVVCTICKGRQKDILGATEHLKAHGYTLLKIDTTEDAFGNSVVVQNGKLEAMCERGHVITTKSMVELITLGEGCPECKNTKKNSGYSRGEAIIAGVLDHVGVKHVHQHPLRKGNLELHCDFYLPNIGIIIEYDGEQHKYGRSDWGTTDKFIRLQEQDAYKDSYATSEGLIMLRVDGERYRGMGIVTALHEVVPQLGIDPKDPYYNELVRSVYNKTAGMFGWRPYEHFREIADYFKEHTIRETKDHFGGFSTNNIMKAFMIVYGTNKTSYVRANRHMI